MKTPILAACLILIAAHSATAAEHVYPSDSHTALDCASTLYDDLNSQFRKQLDPQPVRLGSPDSPAITLVSGAGSRQICISPGFIGLINHLAHARAIDRVQPGFFQQYVRTMGDTSTFKSPDIDDPRFWKDDVMNEQAGYFNQMIGAIMAINLSHIYLGQIDKYSGRMPAGQLGSFHDMLTPDEWENSVKMGISNALECGWATEGVKALFEAIDTMPTRPAWAACVAPNHADFKNLNMELTAQEHKFYNGR